MYEELEVFCKRHDLEDLDDAPEYDEEPENPFNLSIEDALSRQHPQQGFAFNALWELTVVEPDFSSIILYFAIVTECAATTGGRVWRPRFPQVVHPLRTRKY